MNHLLTSAAAALMTNGAQSRAASPSATASPTAPKRRRTAPAMNQTSGAAPSASTTPAVAAAAPAAHLPPQSSMPAASAAASPAQPGLDILSSGQTYGRPRILERPQPLDCVICLQRMTAPVVTPCGHSFCAACLQRYLGYGATPSGIGVTERTAISGEGGTQPDTRSAHPPDPTNSPSPPRVSEKPCPSCSQPLGSGAVAYPNYALTRVLSDGFSAQARGEPLLDDGTAMAVQPFGGALRDPETLSRSLVDSDGATRRPAAETFNASLVAAHARPALNLEQLSESDAKRLLRELLSAKEAREMRDHSEVGRRMAVLFLARARRQRQIALEQAQRDVAALDDDLTAVLQSTVTDESSAWDPVQDTAVAEDLRAELSPILRDFTGASRVDSGTSPNSENVALSSVRQLSEAEQPTPRGAGSEPVSGSTPPPTLGVRYAMIERFHDDVQSLYFGMRRNQDRHDAALEAVTRTLLTATSISTARKRAAVKQVDILNGSSFHVSDVGFSPSGRLLAAGGKSVKIFNFNDLLPSTRPTRSGAPPRSELSGGLPGAPSNSSSSDADDLHCPLVEIPSPSKVSSLCWTRDSDTLLAASTTNGVVFVYDAVRDTRLHEYSEHTMRTWSVDFSCTKPRMLASGSDDRTVRLWDVGRVRRSTLRIAADASVCSVKFSPGTYHEIAFGSADHKVYTYDIRHPRSPLCVFEGHWRAVSYVYFINRSHLVSASTDSSCKLWNVRDHTPGLSYGGHVNDRNFVGLCGSGDFFACGSEDNAVYVYHKDLTGPVVSYCLDSPGNSVTSVCWRPDSNTLVAANNSGTLEAFELE